MKKVLLGLALLFVSATLALAQRTVTGKVTDEQGEPLIGATVLVKGTTSGAVSDVNGIYKVNVSKDDAILVATYSGFATIEIPVGTTNAVDIVMKEGLILQETVVTAFGIKKNKENLGYAVTEISSQELTTGRVTKPPIRKVVAK